MKKLISNKEYHADKSIGSSLLKRISMKSLAHAVSQEVNPTSAMDLGSAIHCAVLEPEKFNNEFIISPKFDKRTIVGKAAFADFQLLAGDKTILDEEQGEIIKEVKKSLKSHEIANGMLTGGEGEYSYFAEIDGQGCKCRPDYFNSNALIDLKTTSDASNDGFVRSCINLGYHIQAAFYLDVFNKANGTNLEEFYFVAVETSKPYAVNTFKMGATEINLGREQYKKALSSLKKFNEEELPLLSFAYENKINEIQFPLWALEKYSV